MNFFKTISSIFTVAVFSMCIAGSANAQENKTATVGVTGGANFANFNDAGVETDAKVGFSAGVFGRFYIPDSPVSIQPEVLYSRKGASGDNIEATLDYIEIPVLARFGFINDSNVTPTVFFGPYVGFNVNAEGTTSNFTFNVEDAVNKTDAGVLFGADVEINKQFTVGGRYSAGLTEVFKDDGATAKNGVFSVMVGVSF